MAILYPHQIANVLVRGTAFEGNIVSVGIDGFYPYNYSDPVVAIETEPADSLFLIYPGAYGLNDTTVHGAKNPILRGMGDAVSDVHLYNGNPASYHGILFRDAYNYLMIENLFISTSHSSGAALVIWDGTTEGVAYLNKLRLEGVASGGFSIGFADAGYPGREYRGDCYITNSRMNVNASYQYRGIGNGNINAIYSFLLLEYNKAYGCDNCTKTPNPHDYVESAISGYGYNYGDYHVVFNVPPPPPIAPDAPWYQNVWVVGENIYHTAFSGIDVYDSTASNKVGEVQLPSVFEEKKIRVDFFIPTSLDDITATVTFSGTNHPVYQDSTTGDDIHFQDVNQNELGFWIYDWNYQGVTTLQVLVPASGTEYIYMLYGNTAGVLYDKGSEGDAALFYDDFSTIYSSNTGMGPDWTIPPEDETQFVVDANGLRVTGEQLGSGIYADAYVETGRGYNFQNPMVVKVSLSDVYAPSAGDGYNQFGIEFTGGSQERDLWGWYIEGLYNQVFRHNDDGTGSGWFYGSNVGMTGEDVTITAYFEADYTRVIADRATNYFDITHSGTNRAPEPSDLRIFSAHDFAYNVDYVLIKRYTDEYGTVYSGAAVDTLQYDVAVYPSAVWANETDIYIATLGGGVMTTEVPVSGTVVAGIYKQEPHLSSNNTTYIHGAGDYLAVSTLAGVDRYDLQDNSRIYTYDENIHKCHQTTSGTLYYIENNSFFGIDESPTGLGRPIREWQYYQQLDFVATTVDNSQLTVVFALDFPYHHLQSAAGDDLRFIDGDGRNLKYFIKEWYPRAEVIVKVALAGTTTIYMLYGNSFAASQSSRDAYYFHDDFDTDLSQWSVYKGHSNNYARIEGGSYLNIYDYDNSGTGVVTIIKLPYSMLIKASIRRGGGSTSQCDNLFGYTTVHTKNRPNAGYVEIDVIQAGDEKLHYLHAVDAAVQGFASFSSSWSEWTGIFSPGYQKSTYANEILELTSNHATFGTENYFMFHIDNSSSNPNVHVDWITFETYPGNTVYTNEEKVFWEFVKPKLHAVYNPTNVWYESDYRYDTFYGDPLILNDIYVTEGTSSYNNNNTIFLATDRGAHIMEERRGDEENTYMKRYYID